MRKTYLVTGYSLKFQEPAFECPCPTLARAKSLAEEILEAPYQASVVIYEAKELYTGTRTGGQKTKAKLKATPQ